MTVSGHTGRGAEAPSVANGPVRRNARGRAPTFGAWRVTTGSAAGRQGSRGPLRRGRGSRSVASPPE